MLTPEGSHMFGPLPIRPNESPNENPNKIKGAKFVTYKQMVNVHVELIYNGFGRYGSYKLSYCSNDIFLVFILDIPYQNNFIK